MARPMATLIGGLCRPPQVFEILFWQLQVLQAQGGGLLQKLGVSARVNVVLHPMGRFGHHITRAEDGWVFLKQSSHIFWH